MPDARLGHPFSRQATWALEALLNSCQRFPALRNSGPDCCRLRNILLARGSDHGTLLLREHPVVALSADFQWTKSGNQAVTLTENRPTRPSGSKSVNAMLPQQMTRITARLIWRVRPRRQSSTYCHGILP